MHPITENYLQATCEVKTPDGRILGTGTLEKILDESIEIHRAQDILPTLHCDTLVNVHVIHKSLESKSLIGKVFLSTSDMMRIADVQNLSDFERRNFFRLKVNLQTQAYVTQQAAPSGEAVQLFPVKARDISLSGCFIESKRELKAGDKLVIALALSSARLSFNCEIKRVLKSDGAYIGYGCSFLDLTKRQTDLLCKFIFEKQREQIKKARGIFDT